MKSVAPTGKLMQVRSGFLASCAAIVGVPFLADIIRGHSTLQRSALLSASIAIMVGWLFIVRNGGRNSQWRSVVSVVTAAYLAASVPVYYFEFSPFRWFSTHPTYSIYVAPWVHWSYALPLLGVIGSFLAQSDARLPLVTASLLLLMLRLSTSTWIH